MTAMSRPPARSADLRNYVLVTGAYWADTIADGAIRMLVLFYFYELGYSPLEVASLFLFYEVFGIVTNLVGGWLAARLGLRVTLLGGLGDPARRARRCSRSCPSRWLVVPYVMVAQALSGIAKDLTKMSSKSAVKLVVPEERPGTLYKWVAILTGSKNALKGVGFFLGGLLLTIVGFQHRAAGPRGLVARRCVVVLALMRGEPRPARPQGEVPRMFSNNRAVNVLAARADLPVRLARRLVRRRRCPVFLRTELGWSFWQVGTFLAVWVIGYGAVQASAPRFVARPRRARPRDVAGVRARRVPRRPSRSRSPPASMPPSSLVAGLIAFGAHLRAELGRALVPDPGLRRRRQGRDERRLLLHGQRRRTPRRLHVRRPPGARGGRRLPACAPRLARAPRSCGCRRGARRADGWWRRAGPWRASVRAWARLRCRRRRTPARRAGRRARRPPVARSRPARRGAPRANGSARRACRGAAGSAAPPPDR